ncbi:restriction endonuclease subunit S [Winogradskyella endarachnes]|uniref:N-6 DNA methylase n=1 Tax=Winogradskyella endarachnes TaxID=2681965 RepID=A0A6L6UCH7_9FLAO|nr:restriction endonuclease subunit S [Winogradskyella endarachnes]MUU78464.1 N-6 DNA methylase [Winogradskyella endarachnes]
MEEKKLIQALGFKPKENTSGIFHKKYNSYAIEIDFEKKQFDFGNKITAGRETTQNFSQQENWVVLECVDRLLEKGYKPENIILEKKYKVGHGASGGWLDILVTREDGSAYLMIECKTWGKEFEKEFKKTEKDGGQLMTYFQQDKSADILMLYASKLDKNTVQFRNEIIKIEDHYRQAGNVEDVFDRWNKVTNTNGIFDDWVKPYLFESKKLTKKDLKPLNEEDSKKIFHEFLSILRKHSVSDKPNAFNKIFNLFLAKIFDEKKRDNKELDFQWKEHKDNAVDFQIRLINLYKSGMYDFLKKEVRGISDDMFSYKTQKELEEKKKHILLFNKVYDIKDVFDEETFEDNQKVLKEVVQLLQKYQIRYPRKQQHLSDFFERLLTTGLKQEAGQFFTPPPITRFIVRSLPISQYIKEQLNQSIPELPAVIDYSVGSGHFLTEVMEEYQRVIEQDIDTSKLETQEAEDFVEVWRKKKYDWASKYVYGIEKDYRLVKVAKVGCYFYGDGLAQVIHGDGLDNFKYSKSYRGLLKKNAEKSQFSFIVSNPPYSVSSFKGDLKNIYANKDFELFDSLTDRSSEIECLFIERTKQLLKTDGIAAIILPSSILSNSGIYAQAREIILKSFDVVAITELGSATFMATGTNTVTLFLKRREDTIAEQVEKSLTTFFTNHKDITINGIEKPIAKYLIHVWEDVAFKDYKTLLQKKPSNSIKQHEIFKEYDKKIKAKKEEDKLAKILDVEKEKLLYFILSFNQKVVLVKTGQKNKEKQFLGYEFSNRRGSEGMHPIQRSKTIDECTQLYDIKDFANENKASTYIHKAFTENKFNLEIPEFLKENVSYQNLIDMLTFDRADFEKNISLTVKKKVKIESKWESKRFDEVAKIIRGVTYSKSDQSNNTTDKIILTADNITLSGKFELNKEIFLNTDFKISEEKRLKKNDIFICFSSGSKQHLGKVAFINDDTEYFAGGFMGIIRVKGNESKYIFQLLNTILRQSIRDIGSGSNINNLSGVINSIKIPLPPIKVQQKIVSEIEVLEKQEEKAVKGINNLRSEIKQYFIDNKGTKKRLDEVCELKAGKFVKAGDIEKVSKPNLFPCYGGNGLRGYTETYTNDGLFSLVGRQGALCGNIHLVDGKFHATEHALVAYTKESVDTFWLHYKLVFMNLNQYATGTAQPGLSVMNLKPIEILLPTLKEQEKIASEIEKLEKKINELETQIAKIPKQKETILKKCLE